MRRFFIVLSAAFASAAIAGCGALTPPGAAVSARQSNLDDDDVAAKVASGAYVPACRHLVLGRWRCFALGLRDRTQAPWSEDRGSGPVRGYGPAQLQAAYNITQAAQSNPGGLVAVVEFGGDPKLEQDLAVYRRQFGLPRCGRSSGCLRVVNQQGLRQPHPPQNDEWLAEQSLDVDMVSANCPNCRILVVEASTNLFAAERTAAKFHPMAISNSWGSFEYPQERRASNQTFHHPGIAITVSSGDFGYATSFPAAANGVTAIGGTALHAAKNARGFTERVWGGTGSGCSLFVSAPSWQVPIEQQLGGCANRIIGDVAYDAAPRTGVAVYESIDGDGEPPGWQVWGGTSVGSPAIAAIYALSGNTSGIPARFAYSNAGALYDIVKGSNGSCMPAYLCTAETGYDGPTGNGTPNGLGAF